MDLPIRMRRNRSDDWLRRMVAENTLGVSDLIWPVFVCEGENVSEDIPSLPGVQRVSVDIVVKRVAEARDLGIPAIAIFPVVPAEQKNSKGSNALEPGNLVCRAVQAIKKDVPGIGVMTDVALDPYTDHGHDGVLDGDEILNDETVEILCRQALNQAKAGTDIIAPSDMMDGRVGAIREILDKHGFQNVKIISYAAKYASAFYGPFRDAINTNGVLQGDKKTYQMNPANKDEALREVELDIEEGADMVIVKPGMPYLDVIHAIKDMFEIPTIAYHVSGEYAMMQAAAQNGWLDYEKSLMEAMICFKRAGADAIITYAALDIAKLLSQPSA